MRALGICALLLLLHTIGFSTDSIYHSLDKKYPITFNGTKITFEELSVDLGPKAFFIDGLLPDEVVARWPYVFNSVKSAVENATNGTENEPMVFYIAPWVYWLDDPDDPAIRKGDNGEPPYALEIECDWLTFYGLTNHPENVVLACNRGQTMGAIGNFTMLKIDGEGTVAENITFGNYCNVDLNFPLDSRLNRVKRGSAIVQAQLIHCNGDKITARNSHFISRLNLCPFVGGKRVFFDRCHFECTDDAMCGTAVYLNSTFDFYSSKPFYNTTGTGAVFINCDIHSMAGGKQYFTKANGQVALIDTRITSENKSQVYIGWNDITPPETRNYQSNVRLNDRPYTIGSESVESTIDISRKNALKAYRFTYHDSVVYNIYNLLRGDDNWDPMQQQSIVESAEKENAQHYIDLPIQLRIWPSRRSIETGKDTLVLTSRLLRFGNYNAKEAQVSWRLNDENSSFLQLFPSSNGESCKIIPNNNTNVPVQVVVVAKTLSGLEAASVVTIAPKKLPPPIFHKAPWLQLSGNGQLAVSYELDTEFEDRSEITWFRCSDRYGNSAVRVAESRNGNPLKCYKLEAGDIGYYIMATVAPRDLRNDAGVIQKVITKELVKGADFLYDPQSLSTNFKNIAVGNQPMVLPGFWTFRPLETVKNGTVIPADYTKDAWYYGEGSQGNAGMEGLLQTQRSATLLYTPVIDKVGDMSIKMIVSPYKTAGQGFSIAPLYMDVLIKFDNETMSGYGLRFQRTTKYGNAVDCYFVEYNNGTAEPINEGLSTCCYRTPCTIELAVEGERLAAYVSTTKDYSNHKYPDVLPQVSMEVPIGANHFGGFGIQYNGGATTMINSVELKWEED